LKLPVKWLKCPEELTSNLIGGGAVAEDVNAELYVFEIGIYLFGRELVELLLDDTVED